jgi:PASTA domain
MTTNIKLDEFDGNWVVVESDVFKLTAIDLHMDAPERRTPGSGGFRRAFVHNAQDGLSVNFEGDYPGGVTVQSDLRVTGRLLLSADATVGALDIIGQLRQGVADLKQDVFDLKRDVAQVSADRIDRIEQSIESLAAMMNASVVPVWRTKEEVEEGDDMGLRAKSASALGLVVEYTILQQDPNFGHGEVVSIAPPPGTVVSRGSTIQVTINLEG